MDARCDFDPMSFGEQTHHLFDLDDLFGGAAEEAQQGLTEGLAEKPKSTEFLETMREMDIAAPGQSICQRLPIAFSTQVSVDGGRGAQRFSSQDGCSPNELAARIALNFDQVI